MSFLTYIWDILPALAQGLKITMIMTATSMGLAAVVAVLVALGKMYGPRPLQAFCAFYIELFRGTPLLVQLFIIYYGLPEVGLNFTSLVAAVVGFGLNSGAYQAEYLRGAIQSIKKGQLQAARSVGMSFLESLRTIVLPQAFRRVIPSWSNDVIYTLKYTSVAFMIGAQELTSMGKIMAGRYFRFTDTFIVVGIIYLILVYIFSKSVNKLEKALKVPGFEMRD
ncbi:MAG: amino acid ABC transporter permease [Candidatus Bipolaricaulia bacterium]